MDLYTRALIAIFVGIVVIGIWLSQRHGKTSNNKSSGSKKLKSRPNTSNNATAVNNPTASNPPTNTANAPTNPNTASPAARGRRATSRRRTPAKKVNSKYVPAFGIWQINSSAIGTVVANAISSGYVEFDSSDNYGNEAELAVALNSHNVKRIYTKIDPIHYNNIIPSIQTAQRLFQGSGQLVIMLHWPGETTIQGSVAFPGANGVAAYRNLARLISRPAVSNFGVSHLTRISRIKKPYLNQIEINPLLQQTEIIRYCKKRNILVQAFSPLASGRLNTNPIVVDIASKHSKFVAQILIRYAYQKGADIVNVKTTNLSRMQENLDINDFVISKHDMRRLNGLRDDASYLLGTSNSAPSPQVFGPFQKQVRRPVPSAPPLGRLGYHLNRRLKRIRTAGRTLINTP